MTTQQIDLLKSGQHLSVKTSTGREIEIGMITASLGVRFVAVYRNGKRVRSGKNTRTSVMFGSWTCNDWLDHLEVVG